ncbi:MAG: hypothetical protein ACI80N_002579 [Gammaproteobacteria bacterium]
MLLALTDQLGRQDAREELALVTIVVIVGGVIVGRGGCVHRGS